LLLGHRRFLLYSIIDRHPFTEVVVELSHGPGEKEFAIVAKGVYIPPNPFALASATRSIRPDFGDGVEDLPGCRIYGEKTCFPRGVSGLRKRR
jgi:hypothetical protein